MTKRFLTIFLVAIALLLPIEGMAQKAITREKKTKTEETKPAKKPSKSKSVKVSEPDGYINGHGYVDLGLPSGIKWATCNVGASSPAGYGNYFAWGETSTKSSYTNENSKTRGRDFGDISGDPNYDVARAKWGGTWRMPTKAECVELARNSKCDWIPTGGYTGGFKVTGPNGKSIFLPATGDYKMPSQGYGNYWTSTPHETNNLVAYIMDYFWRISRINNGSMEGRNKGLSVRPVSE